MTFLDSITSSSKTTSGAKKTPIVIKKKKTSDNDKTETPSKEKTAKSPSKVAKPVVKSTESTGNSGGFFGSMGFKKPEEETNKKTTTKKIETADTHKNEEIEKVKKEKTTAQSNEDFLLQATEIAKKNAVVIRRPEDNRGGGGYQGNSPRSGGGKGKGSNISFAPGEQRQRSPYQGGQNATRPPQHGGHQGQYQGGSGGYKGGSGGYKGGNRGGKRHYHHEEAALPKGQATAANKISKEVGVSDTLTKKESITISDTISVKEFSEKSGLPFQEILKCMLSNKIMGGINTVMDFDTANIIGMELGIAVIKEQEKVSIDSLLAGDLNAILEQDKFADHKESRPPIVTVMGHVDHGKTSLLDYLRKTKVASGEAGGITQSIGASMITHQDKQITFIDTPGHELFTNLRARGAKLTNIVIIVIAADDGLKPQTIESINHAKDANVPIIIAITKIDKGTNKVEQIKADIGTYGLIPEEWGGTVPIIGVSSVTGQGIPELLDQILFQSELLDLSYNAERKAVGVVIDAHKDNKQGVLTSLIVLTGTLKVGDIVVVHNTYGKIRKMINALGHAARTAKGGEPVMILGINEIPEPGRVIEVVDNEKEAQKRITAINESMESESKSTISSFIEQMKKNDGAVLKIICKSNGPSSLEAMIQAINQIPFPKNVSLKIIHSGVGDVAESDLALAQASGAVIMGFNIAVSSMMKKKADMLKITVKTYDIIYNLTDYITDAMQGLVEKEYQEVQRGKLTVLGVFFRKDKMMIIGGKVIEGKVGNGMKFRVYHGEEEAAQGEITSLQRDTQSVKEVAEGYECGMKVRTSKKISEGDTLVFYEMEEIVEGK